MSSIEVSIPLGDEDFRAIAGEAKRRSCSEGDALKRLALERAEQIVGIGAAGSAGDVDRGAAALAALEAHARRIAQLEREAWETRETLAEIRVCVGLLARDIVAAKGRFPDGGSG